MPAPKHLTLDRIRRCTGHSPIPFSDAEYRHILCCPECEYQVGRLDDELIDQPLPAITLWQPWASLLAHAIKRCETRYWYTRHRGPLAIHAAQRWARDQRDLCADPAFRPHLALISPEAADSAGDSLPRGHVLAVGYLEDLWRTENADPHLRKLKIDIPTERALGDYRSGRWAWQFSAMELLLAPLPATGGQGLWEWRPPTRYLWASH